MKKLLLRVMVGLCAISSVMAFAGCGNEDPQSGECKHQNVSESIVTAATCETEGVKDVVCDDCGALVEKNVAIYRLGHDFDKRITPANCENDEKWTFVCQREGCVKRYSETQEGTSLGHDYQLVESESVKATCEQAGKHVYRCSRKDCAESYDDMVPVMEHISDGIKEDVTTATCSNRGYTTYHCTSCDKDYQANFVEPTGEHDYEKSTINATCTAFGYTVYACKCNDVQSREISENPKPHEFETDGICKNCSKDALEAFALNYDDTGTSFLIEKDRNVYTVYSKAYEEQNIVIPVSMLEALYEKGVKSLRISMGYGKNQEAIDLSVKVQNGKETKLTAKAINGVMTKIGDSIVFAGDDGLIDNVKTTGIVISVKYGASGQTEASDEHPITNYSIAIDYDTMFDVADARTWLLSDGVSMNIVENAWPDLYNIAYQYDISPLKVYGEEDSGVTVLILRKELLQKMYSDGKKKFEVGVWMPGVFNSFNIRDGYAEDSTLYLQNPLANGSAWPAAITLTEEVCAQDLYFEVQCSVNDTSINKVSVLFAFTAE